MGIPVEGRKPEDPPVGTLKGYLLVPLMEYGGTTELAPEVRGTEALVRVPIGAEALVRVPSGAEVLARALVGAILVERVTGGVITQEGLFAQSLFSRSFLRTST